MRRRAAKTSTLSASRRFGFTLVELMLAMLLGLGVVAALLQAYVSSNLSARQSLALNQVSADAGLALALLRHDIALAGTGFPTSVDSLGFVYEALERGLLGCSHRDPSYTKASADLTSLSCAPSVSGGAVAQTQTLALAYAADTATNMPAGPDHLPADCVGNGVPASAALGQGSYVVFNRYFVSDKHELSCLGNGSTVSQPLVENIWDLRFQYGVDDPSRDAMASVSKGPVVAYLSADEIRALGAHAALNPWRRVGSVRVCLVARSAQEVLAKPSPYYDCDAQWRQPPDRRLYRAFTTTVVVPN